MPEVEYVTTMNLPPETVWEFVKDMNNWAPFLTGYQRHVIESDTDSIWTLKGDVGVLSRVVQLKAHVTEWAGPEKVSFTLTGLNEPVDGGGTLLIGRCSDEAPPPPEAPRARGFFGRLIDRIFGALFRRFAGGGPRRLAPSTLAREASQLRFTLRMEAGGITGPLVNAMLAPALRPAAEDLANKIAAHLEKVHGVTP